jgi:hypothetical protein
MKLLAIILSAGVVAGLAVFTVLDAFAQLTVAGPLLTLPINAFIATLCGACFGAAGLALVFRAAMARADRNAVRQLEDRIARLENRGVIEKAG